ncbi:MAG: FkbM family methyltransferase [Sphingopyxis sp.]|uniref:FkbM family methyltransferase n=1 Tax=Sphingopyxis sp. TaxID=1908224 RepID=UPI0032EBCCB2
MKKLIKSSAKSLFARFPASEAVFRRTMLRWVSPRLFYHEPEMRVLHALPARSMDVVLDVGAAMGSFCWILKHAAREIHAFEPGREHNRALRAATRFSNVRVVRAAVGEKASTVRLYTPGADSNDRYYASVSADNPIARQEGALWEDVPQIALDDYCASNIGEDRQIDFIKIDVEGYEFNALVGARRIIEKHHPMVMIEIEQRHNPEYYQVFEFMFDLGYSASVMKGEKFVPHDGRSIEENQRPEDLERRLHGPAADKDKYINNFFFSHNETRISLKS